MKLNIFPDCGIKPQYILTQENLSHQEARGLSLKVTRRGKGV